MPRLGLVLTGGGARGGYEVGVLEYLAETGRYEPVVIAGASIGALNGAEVSAAGNLADGAANLRAAWQEVCSGLDPPTGLVEDTDGTPRDAMASIGSPQAGTLARLAALIASRKSPVPGRLGDIVGKWAPAAELRRGTELWVTIFPAVPGGPAGLGWFVDVLLGKLGKDAFWRRVQEAGEHAHNLLFASAAIPPVLPAHLVDGQPFRDGGIGNNLPIEPLVERGCTHAIVVHLSRRNLWDARPFGKEMSIIEIRPQGPLAAEDRLGQFESLLDFSPASFDQRRRQGYEDARRWIEDAEKKDRVLREYRNSLHLLQVSTADLSGAARTP